jgi:prepilin-type N-terminal cleavage/methylation domain-containing protein/prepilin-type processing-associated H-X9-DG protein
MRSQRAFTLVELLVVIGIIALLLSILLPSLNKARSASRRIVCLSNVRQMNAAMNLYFGTSNGKFLPYYNTGGQYRLWMGHLKAFGLPDSARVCPETPTNNAASGGTYGTAALMWGPNNPSAFDAVTGQGSTGAYALNGWLYRLGVGPSDAILYNNANRSGAEGMTNAQMDTMFIGLPARDVTRIPVFSDSVWVDGWPRAIHPPPANVYNPTQSVPHMHRFCIARHGRAVCIGFLDGHAESVALPDLWTLKWHNGWSTPNPLPTVP